MKHLLMYLTYTKAVLRHKKFVLLAGLQYGGVPLFSLLIHDWTKFLPVEFFAYANYFYSGRPTRKEDGTLISDPIFDAAWNHHQKINKHHWQAWVLLRDDGTIEPLEIPDRHRREMLADWIGAGRAYGSNDVMAWYEKNKHKMLLHEETRAWIEDMISWEI